uniref:Uncharacterized protein n=1 Tax=Leersia perrieri TaxID=77586 RepID=A0A0D9W7H4_9ORYZ
MLPCRHVRPRHPVAAAERGELRGQQEQQHRHKQRHGYWQQSGAGVSHGNSDNDDMWGEEGIERRGRRRCVCKDGSTRARERVMGKKQPAAAEARSGVFVGIWGEARAVAHVCLLRCVAFLAFV